MARHIDPVCRLCRREGIKLYLKGSRCESPKCAIERRNQPPGMHTRRGKQTEYGDRLREKQKLKRFYGILERQFRRYFSLAARSTENTGEALLSLLERRLDNVVHRLGFAPSRAAARQLVAHGHITLNGKNCDIPSLIVKKGDTIAVKNRPKSIAQVKLNQTAHMEPIPDFLEITGSEPPEGMLKSVPGRGDVDPRLNKDRELNEQLIIEFCSR
ncbi:MAG: 30S ribosomal protein S4 [Planctomycetes bacterium]|jgi:small subunit ribosomal protein S4|nr:30S ribosomal protein S4 [Planctomycetota bacterium]